MDGDDWELIHYEYEIQVEDNDKCSQLNCSCCRNAVGQVGEEEGSHQVSKIKLILWDVGDMMEFEPSV